MYYAVSGPESIHMLRGTIRGFRFIFVKLYFCTPQNHNILLNS